MSDPKEALERLKWDCDRADERGDTTAITSKADLRTFIAEREGLEREVARLTGALKDVDNPLGRLKRLADERGNKLSGEAYSIANSLSYVQSIAREALLHPTVPVERKRAFNPFGTGLSEPRLTVEQMDAVLSVAPPSQGMETGKIEKLIRDLRKGHGLTEQKAEDGGVWRDAWVHKTMQEAADALAAFQSHKGGEGDSELAAADNNYKAES